MVKINFLAIFLLLPIFCFSQDKGKINITFDTVFELDNLYFGDRGKRLKFGISTSKDIFCFERRFSDSLVVKFPFKNKSFVIKEPFLKNHRIKNIIVQDKHIVIFCFKRLYLFEINDSKVNYLDSVVQPYGEAINYYGDKILLYNNYNYHHLNCPPLDRTKFTIYSITNKKFEIEKRESFNYYFYTHLISSFVDVSPSLNRIALSQTIPYKITFLDTSLNTADSILGHQFDYNKDDLDNIDKFVDTIRAIGASIKYVIRKASKNDKEVDRIIKIYYLDDTTLLVVKKMSYSNKELKERNLDVWQLENGKWVLKVDNQHYFSSIINKQSDKFKIHVPFRSSNQVFVKAPYIYFIGTYSPYNSFNNYADVENFFKTRKRSEVKHGIYRFTYEVL